MSVQEIAAGGLLGCHRLQNFYKGASSPPDAISGRYKKGKFKTLSRKCSQSLSVVSMAGGLGRSRGGSGVPASATRTSESALEL